MMIKFLNLLNNLSVGLRKLLMNARNLKFASQKKYKANEGSNKWWSNFPGLRHSKQTV